MCHWTHLFAQDSTGRTTIDQPSEHVMKYGDTVGVFIPEIKYRIYREDQRKGFTHFANLQITEIQLNKCDSLRFGAEVDRDRYKENFELEQKDYQTQVELNATLESTAKDLLAENGKLRKKIKLLPWFTVGGFLLGAIVVVAAR